MKKIKQEVQMGKLILTFWSNGKEIDRSKTDTSIGMRLYNLDQKFGFSMIEKIDTTEDIQIKINVDEIEDEIKWENFSLPTSIIENIKEIESCCYINNCLSEILVDLKYCNDKYEVEKIGKKAILIAEGIPELKFDRENQFRKDISVKQLKDVVCRKEIPNLMSIKHSASKRKFEEAFHTAKKRLRHSIETTIMYFEKYNDYLPKN